MPSFWLSQLDISSRLESLFTPFDSVSLCLHFGTFGFHRCSAAFSGFRRHRGAFAFWHSSSSSAFIFFHSVSSHRLRLRPHRRLHFVIFFHAFSYFHAFTYLSSRSCDGARKRSKPMHERKPKRDDRKNEKPRFQKRHQDARKRHDTCVLLSCTGTPFSLL